MLAQGARRGRFALASIGQKVQLARSQIAFQIIVTIQDDWQAVQKIQISIDVLHSFTW